MRYDTELITYEETSIRPKYYECVCNLSCPECKVHALYYIVMCDLSLPYFSTLSHKGRRSQWPRGLRRRSAATCLLRSWVRIPPGAWMFVCCECCVLSGRGLCDKLITRPEESYLLWCVVVCDLENLKNEEAMTRVGSQRHRKKK